MIATFLVECNIDDTDLLRVAEDLKEALLDSGVDVNTVRPWKRESLAVGFNPLQPSGGSPPPTL